MNLFEAVKDAVPTRTAAEHYGIEVKRNGMACCPFHDDRTPSMKVDKRFHCFGCQEDGDVIDFVGKLFDLSPKRAAEKLAEDFGVRYEGLQTWQPQRRPSVISKLAAAQEYRKKENRCYRVLCEYLHLLRDWKEQYAPQPEDEDWHPLFCEALQKMDYVEYLLDELISGTLEERTAIVKEKEKDLDGLEKKIAAFDRRGTADQQRDSFPGKVRSVRLPQELAM
ncbi:DNA primase [Pseudoflavonifractor sp. 60]|uniref:CHC2 zinc finger domain-containing protein n=1 Tax=Pseudoflavonifractor sp. 60 TaxID=2304576 RepID=UPI0013690855|nr:CHC2 zinc finger domain-containing protein [Pseudoflavonifractor sp. 60]NBI66296.1 DNA primase [Pseudoflavonifractor sp. 60]